MKWEAKLVKHRGQSRIVVYFEKSQDLINRIRKLDGALWSVTMRAWHVPDTDDNRKRFNLEPRFIFNPLHATKLQEFKMWMRSRRLSESTVKTYFEAMKTFLSFYNDRPVEDLTADDVIFFNNEFILKNNLSLSYQNQVVNAIKHFFKTIELRRMNLELVHRPKREKLLPNVLSKEEVKEILEAHYNIKHKAMLSLIYSCGLRCGELLALQPHHIDSLRNIVLIKRGKGKKDRIAPLSPKILELLRVYFKQYKPKTYLFEGNEKGKPYDERSLQLVLKSALQKCSITKPVTLHWLRHSYATHLLENGIDLRYIQEILGHKSSRTTEIYTHVSTKSIQKIVSPFDYL